MLFTRRFANLGAFLRASKGLKLNVNPLYKLQYSNHKILFSTSKPAEKMEFKAETKKLLDIVAKSLYTDSEVFLR
jgi:hypothetical protein